MQFKDKKDVINRFNKKYTITKSGCWNWTGCSRGKTRYGAMKIDGKVMSSHRVSYIIYKGDINDNLYVCHTCDNRLCVNPDHLFLGSAKDNYHDSVSKGTKMGKQKLDKIDCPSWRNFKEGCRCEKCDIYRIRRIQYSRKYRERDKTKVMITS